MDINLFEIAMGGATELKAEWTEQGKKNIANSVSSLIVREYEEMSARFNSVYVRIYDSKSLI